MKSVTLRLLLVCLLGIIPSLAGAEGNLARRAERLDPLKLNAAEGFSIKT
jgi:hypothetical protein